MDMLHLHVSKNVLPCPKALKILFVSHSPSILFSAGTRWRRVPVDYASTSEDEYGSNRHISKQGHTRPFPSTRVTQLGGSAPATPTPASLAAFKQNSRDQDEYMRDWTAHSEEIAR